ncbi:MAG: beta-N-acetylhexosaminidase [Thermomonas sp.]|uniref:beta-N-acetylhexosaminidase n=1 Tax=Thermomonas sp. TaxID=1971895 RepID=UPI001EC45E5A|nr:beta-N-acetylhexosaminidase [Thermomonas sp.]MBV2208133.1 beta-N-acetylhexosaminidase [Thermomonas sp.]
MKLQVLAAGALSLALLGCVHVDTPHHELATPQAPALVPVPQTVDMRGGEWVLPDTVWVQADVVKAPFALEAMRQLMKRLNITHSAAAPAQVQLQIVDDKALGEEGYRLTIGQGITLQAQTDNGLLHAVASLQQLLPAVAQAQYRLPRLTITDAPRYAWRGLSLDVARSFLPVSYLEQTIDRMALFKLNRLHLHLTDDQGWRIEIKRYPKLIEIGGASAVKGGRSGYYTQQQLRQLVLYARTRGVTIVPEIDMPGHVQAALASYNELACDGVKNLSTYDGKEVGFSVLCLDKPEVVYPFVENVLKEVLAVFPSKEIHVGGDEIKHPKYADFVARTAAMVEKMGRTPIAWEEGSVADTNPKMLLQLWNDGYNIAPAVAKGHGLILSPCSYFYIDHGNYAGQPNTYDWCRKEGVPLARVYAFDPAKFPTAVGVEGALWSELVHTNADADNRLWPRMAAVAEVAWSPASQRSYAGFTQRMGALLPQLDALGVAYHPEPDLK